MAVLSPTPVRHIDAFALTFRFAEHDIRRPPAPAKTSRAGGRRPGISQRGGATPARGIGYPMRSRRNDALWMGSACFAALCLASLVLGTLGAGERGTYAALAATARLSFLLFWVAYSGSAITAVFGGVFGTLKAHTREFGLAFASAHLVHIGLVAWLCEIGHTPAVSVFVFFGIALFWTYLLALFSISHLRESLNPVCWWLLREVGMNYIAYAFAVDFMKNPFDLGAKHLLEYVPFAILAVLGPILRLVALVMWIEHKSSDPSYRTR